MCKDTIFTLKKFDRIYQISLNKAHFLYNCAAIIFGEKMTLIYIHGFGGNGEGKKAQLFREYAQQNNYHFIAPSLSYVPTLAIKTLEELTESYRTLGEEVVYVGSSLGGFYATYLADKYATKAALINPAVQAYETLSKVITQGKNYFDGSYFEWNSGHIKMLENYHVDNIDTANFFLLVQTADEVLDYTFAVTKFKGSKQLIEQGGDHSFIGIERHFDAISTFLEISKGV